MHIMCLIHPELERRKMLKALDKCVDDRQFPSPGSLHYIVLSCKSKNPRVVNTMDYIHISQSNLKASTPFSLFGMLAFSCFIYSRLLLNPWFHFTSKFHFETQMIDYLLGEAGCSAVESTFFSLELIILLIFC